MKVSEELIVRPCGVITMVNLPEMLRMVKSAGTAMAMVRGECRATYELRRELKCWILGGSYRRWG